MRGGVFLGCDVEFMLLLWWGGSMGGPGWGGGDVFLLCGFCFGGPVSK